MAAARINPPTAMMAINRRDQRYVFVNTPLKSRSFIQGSLPQSLRIIAYRRNGGPHRHSASCPPGAPPARPGARESLEPTLLRRRLTHQAG